MSTLSEKIDACIKAVGLDRTHFANEIGIPESTIRNWKRYSSVPAADVLFKISKYFGVPLEYIISGNESPIDDATAAFIVQTQGLTEEQKKVIYASIKAQVDMFKTMNNEKQ